MGVQDGDALGEDDLLKVPFIFKFIDNDATKRSSAGSGTEVWVAGGTVNAGDVSNGILVFASLKSTSLNGATAEVTLRIGEPGGAGTARLTQDFVGADAQGEATPEFGKSMVWYETDQTWSGTVLVNLTVKSTSTSDTGSEGLIILGN